jgi:hypothetical protein
MPTVGLDVALSVFEDEVWYATGQLGSLRRDLGDRLAHTQIAVRVGERVREIVRYAREYSVGEVVVPVDRRMPKFMSAGAYSTPNRTQIPRQAEHAFHGKPNMNSTLVRTRIPREVER